MRRTTVQNKHKITEKPTSNKGGTNNNGEGGEENEDIGSKTFGRVPSSARSTSKHGSVRAFVQANRNQNRIINSTSMFQNETKSDEISLASIKNARKSGVLNISGRNLINVPPKVWTINELDENEKSTVSVSLDEPSTEKWWEFVDLNKLIIANNYITDIPDDIGNLMSLQVFDAHDNQITKLSARIGGLTNLSKFNASKNRLRELPESFFALKRLTELQLSHNNLNVISTEIGTLSCLRILDLSHNQITSIPGDIGFLSFLNTLNLSHNGITELPEEIGSLTALRSFDASENSLETCPTFKDLCHLELLYLQRNKITQLPDISGCKALKELYMQNNLLTEFDSETFALLRVQLLDFRSNKIKTLNVENNQDLEFVDRFYLDNNEISNVPNELCLLPSLKALTLDGNPLHGIRLDILQRGTLELLKYLRGRVPNDSLNHSNYGNDTQDGKPTASCRKSLRGGSTADDLEIDRERVKASRDLNLVGRNMCEIDDSVILLAADARTSIFDVSKNVLTSLPSSMELLFEFVNELKLDFNRLTSLPPCLGRFSRLQYLTVQNNQIDSLPKELEGLRNLREINLGYNRFSAFPEVLYTLRCLEIIILINNKIEKIDAERLGKLPMLSVLDLCNNNIAQVPPELGLLELKSLNLEGNAFRVPSYHILSRGTDAVLTFLRNRIPK